MLRFSLTLAAAVALAGEPLPEGPGLAAQYPGGAGIESHPAVVFVENFDADLAAVARRWDHVNNKGAKALALEDSTLRMTATRGENEGGHLFRVLRPGYDRLFLRFYVKFAPDNGFHHHFVSLGGEIDPPPYPVGRAGLKPENRWNSGIEPVATSPQTSPSRSFDPPGIWHFYTYWPEMRSWQNADGTGTSFYGNDFEPKEPPPAPRGQWICVEAMVKMNSSPEATDGEQAFWIDGKLAAHFAPGTPAGYWFRDIFRHDAEKGTPFPGFRWRTDMRVNINKLWLSHYVSETAFARTSAYAAKNPDAQVNTQTNTVWFDNLVLATEYIGPMSMEAGAQRRGGRK